MSRPPFPRTGASVHDSADRRLRGGAGPAVSRFEVDTRIARAYAQRNPQDPAMLDLGRWHDLEAESPNLFAAMYQFAVQKR
jgi:hypothetical protein